MTTATRCAVMAMTNMEEEEDDDEDDVPSPSLQYSAPGADPKQVALVQDLGYTTPRRQVTSHRQQRVRGVRQRVATRTRAEQIPT